MQTNILKIVIPSRFLLRNATLLLLSLSSTAYAYVDLQVGFSYSTRRVEALNASGEIDKDGGEALATNRGFNINWAWYLWEYTALEFNYAESEQQVVDDRVATSSDGTTIFNNINSLIKTKTEGVGIRQTFASRKARFIPSLSIGYARYTTSGQTKYQFTRSGVDDEVTIDRAGEVVNSSYATVSLAIRITKRMRLTVSANSIVPGVEIDQADKNITYSGGLSWIF
jgi:hypothetical protein